jgi:hypothetical protein
MLVIPIQAVPSQQVLCVLGGQNCQIAIYQKGNSVFVDLNSNGTDMCVACLAHNAVPLDSCNSYDGFQGNLYFIDSQGLDDPEFTGFNTRWFLVYLTAAEVAETEVIEIQPLTLLMLAATLQVNSSVGGSFSVAHGLSSVPSIIEIVPSSAGAIWAQSQYADANNIYLVASDADQTATIHVYLPAPAALDYVVPWSTLQVTAPGAGPFTISHGLGTVPSLIEMLPISNSPLWTQEPAFDETNVYLEALEAGSQAVISVFPGVNGIVNILAAAELFSFTSTAPGSFSFTHGLPNAPSRIAVLMLSGGFVWGQSPAFDQTNVYLEASDVGINAIILVFA